MWACAAIECHMRSGKHKRKGAAELIATQQPVLLRLMREGRKVTRKELTNSLVSWHREFQQGNTNEIVQPLWQWFLDSLEVRRRLRTPLAAVRHDSPQRCTRFSASLFHLRPPSHGRLMPTLRRDAGPRKEISSTWKSWIVAVLHR
jgi:hypothetical protein